MSRSAIAAVVIAIIVVVGGGILLATHNSSNKSSNSSSSSMGNMHMNSSQSSTNSSEKTATNNVTIENFAFSPANITVKKGTTVTWTNKDSATHTVTSTSGPKSFDSGGLVNGKGYSMTFDTVGTYNYHCSIHPNMTGMVTVTD